MPDSHARLKMIGTGKREGLGAADGIRTRDPHLGNGMVDVSCVSTGLTSAPELRVLGKAYPQREAPILPFGAPRRASMV